MEQKIKIFLIDDDVLDLAFGEKIISTSSKYEWMGSTSNVEEGIQLVKKLKPEIVLLDIEMPNINGLELAKQFKDSSVHVVFLSSHTSYALDAFKTQAIHYIQKPLMISDLQSVADRYYSLKNKFNFTEEQQIDELINICSAKAVKIDKIFVQKNNQIEFIDVDDIIYLEEKKEETIIVLNNKKIMFSNKNMDSYRNVLLNNLNFKPIHSTFLINNNYLESLLSHNNSTFLFFKNDVKLTLDFVETEEWYDALL